MEIRIEPKGVDFCQNQPNKLKLTENLYQKHPITSLLPLHYKANWRNYKSTLPEKQNHQNQEGINQESHNI